MVEEESSERRSQHDRKLDRRYQEPTTGFRIVSNTSRKPG